MKLMIAADIHGSFYYASLLFKKFEELECDRILLLGDLLYHGPRNELPKDYNPKQCIALLNAYKHKIIAVRGNCDSEVDQMVLEFPMMADYILVETESYSLFATHGHVYQENKLPPLQKNALFVSGHTHIPLAKKENGVYFLNPGSVSIPKEHSCHSFGILEHRKFSLFSLDGNNEPWESYVLL